MADDIWVIRGREPVLWTVPYRVRWYGNECELVRLLPPLLAHQERALMEFFNQRAGNRFTMKQLLEVGHRLPEGANAEESFSWERPHQRPERPPEARKDRDEWLDFAYQKGLGASRAEVEYWWNQLCGLMLDWLINRERPLDFYFLRLHPLPYQFNWKEKIWKYRRRRTFKGLADMVRRGLIFSMSGESLQRHVEVEHLGGWRRTIEGVEKTRLMRLGRAGYAKAIVESGLQAEREAGRLLRQHTQLTRSPLLALYQSGVGGPMVVGKKVRHRKLGKALCAARRLARKNAFAARPRPQRVRRAKPKLPKLRVVRPAPPDLWDGRGYVAPAGERRAMLARVLVLLAAEKRHADQLLAVQPDGGPAGLASPVEQLP